MMLLLFIGFIMDIKFFRQVFYGIIFLFSAMYNNCTFFKITKLKFTEINIESLM